MKHNEIQVGEVQETSLSKDLKLLYIREQNPVGFLINYAKENGLKWLSLPESIKEVGIKKLIKLSPEYTEIYFQNKIKKTGWPEKERISPALIFNSYVINQLVGDDSINYDDRVKIYIGHDLNLKDDIKREHNVFYFSNKIEVCKSIDDILKNFRLKGDNLKEIAWLQADLIKSQELVSKMFKYSLDEVRKQLNNKINIHTGPSLSVGLASENVAVYLIKMNKDLKFSAWNFFNRNDEFTSYALLKQE